MKKCVFYFVNDRATPYILLFPVQSHRSDFWLSCHKLSKFLFPSDEWRSERKKVHVMKRRKESQDYYSLSKSNFERWMEGVTRHLCSAKRRCIVYVVMFCASRDHKSWQGVASLRDATRKGVEQLTRKSFSIRFSRALPIFFDSVR